MGTWKIRVGALSSTITCRAEGNNCTTYVSQSVENSTAVGAPGEAYYRYAQIGQTHAYSPSDVLALSDTGCANRNTSVMNPSLWYSIFWGTSAASAKINRTVASTLVNQRNGGVRLGGGCEWITL